MALPPLDEQYLCDRQIGHSVCIDAGMVCVVVPGWNLPPGLNVRQVDVMLRLAPGYPDVAPDMWWVSPTLVCADGSVIPATQSHEQHLGRDWQRWSRHFAPGQWQSGIDGLESFFALIQAEFEAAGRSCAA
jgi:hypothetical protein